MSNLFTQHIDAVRGRLGPASPVSRPIPEKRTDLDDRVSRELLGVPAAEVTPERLASVTDYDIEQRYWNLSRRFPDVFVPTENAKKTQSEVARMNRRQRREYLEWQHTLANRKAAKEKK